MSLTEYFDGDANLVKYFRQAYHMKQEAKEKENDYNAWLQGLYIYNATDSALYNNMPFIERKQLKFKEYIKQPLLAKEEEKIDEEAEKRLEEAKMAIWLENFVHMYKDVENC